MDFDGLTYRAAALLETARNAGVRLATAESCTGGLVSALLTDIPGSSHVFDRGFVTYSNEAKHEILSVPMELIQTHGAVSEEVARAMAQGALALSRADIAVAITGIAGPGGGTDEKPVGTVCFAVTQRDGETRSETRYYGDMGRSRVRMKSVEKALKLMELFL